MNVVQHVGKELKKADPTETVPGNMVLRVLKMIRDEYQRLELGLETSPDAEDVSFGIMQIIDQERDFDYKTPLPALQEAILDNLNECKSEICGSAENISKEAEKHIINGEVIMTLGKSKTVEAFLRKAVRKGRKFQVIVAECAPFCNVGRSLGVVL